jgi:hypothetical protein
MASPTITTTYQKVIYERKGANGEALWLTLNRSGRGKGLLQRR